MYNLEDTLTGCMQSFHVKSKDYIIETFDYGKVELTIVNNETRKFQCARFPNVETAQKTILNFIHQN